MRTIDLKKKGNKHRFRKAFSALIQRTEALIWENTRVVGIYFFPLKLFFPFPIKRCRNVAVSTAPTELFLSFFSLRQTRRILVAMLTFWLGIRPFLDYIEVLSRFDAVPTVPQWHPVQQIQKCPITSTYCIHAHLLKTRWKAGQNFFQNRCYIYMYIYISIAIIYTPL